MTSPPRSLRQSADNASVVLSDAAFQGVRPFEPIRPGNVHLPPIVRLRANDRNPPVAEPVGKHVLDCCADFGLSAGISDVVHLDGNLHKARNTTQG
jgi:hypothetical protein